MQALNTTESEALLNCLCQLTAFKQQLVIFNTQLTERIEARTAAVAALRYLEAQQIEVLRVEVNWRVPQLALVYSPNCEALKSAFNGFRLTGVAGQCEQWCVSIFGCFVYWKDEGVNHA